MSILACLIGILTLMISVSMKARQLDENEGLTEEELASATSYRDLKSRIAALNREHHVMEERMKKERKSSAELARLEETKVELGAKIAKAEASVRQAAGFEKTMNDLKREIAEIKQERPLLQKQVDDLQARIKTAIAPRKPVESILIKPGGQGFRGSREMSFVECSGQGVIIYQNGKPTPAIPTASLETSGAYKSFLERMKRTPDSMILFLVRRSGSESYRWAAGIAEANYQLTTGKLPMPNDGPIDLKLIK